MKVKCKYCGTYIEKNVAYKDQNKKNSYYCNEEHYLAIIKRNNDLQKEKEDAKKAKEEKKKEKEREKEKQKEISAARKAKRDAVYYELCDIFGYEVQNSILFTEWILWNKLANDEKILAYLQENKDYIKSKMERTNGTEYARIRYLSAILKNSLHDYKVEKKTEPTKITVNYEMYEPVVSTKKKRRGLSELEDEVT